MADDKLERLRALAQSQGVTEAGPRTAVDDKEARKFLRRATGEGAGRAREVIPPAFLNRRLVTADLGPAVLRFRRPEWLADLIHEGRPRPEVLGALAERVIERPNEENLRTAETVLNDLGRRPEAAESVRALVTQDVVDRILAGGA